MTPDHCWVRGSPARIRVYCAGPGHARGKAATIAIFDRDERGVWTDQRQTRRRRSYRSRADSPSVFKCKLCGRELPVWAEERRVLFPLLDFVARQGRVEIPLPDLVDLASSFEKGG